ncbi:MAG: class I SAM-dependent methyltransferase [Pseudomonadota bacterium]
MPLDATSDEFPTQKAIIPVFSGWFGSWQVSLARRPYTSDELTTHYNRQAHLWHAKVRRLGFEEAYRYVLGKVLRQGRYAQATGPLHVLDAGVGTGAMSLALCDLIDQPIQLDGVDLSPEMLSETTKRLGRCGINAELQKADLEALPFEDARYDIVLAAHVLEHLANPDRALAELYRVLKPGGVLIVFMTRQSSAGAYIQFIWRTHRVAMASALAWLRQTGLQSVRAVPLGRHSVARKLSVGYVGRKPIEAWARAPAQWV